MFTESFSFPHPVLGISDDISGSINADINVFRNNETRSIQFEINEIDIDNSYFIKLLSEGIVSVMFKIHCSSTMQTWVILYESEDFSIPEDQLANKIEIQLYLISNKKIEKFFDESFNDDYSNEIFQIEKNEVVGVSGKIILPINKTNEKLGLGNIFKFFANKNLGTPLSFEYHHDKIHINYPVTDTGKHPPEIMFKTYGWTAFSIFILPALSGAFDMMKLAPLEFDQYEWYTVLDSLLPEDERSASSFHNAQILIKNDLPLINSFKELINQK